MQSSSSLRLGIYNLKRVFFFIWPRMKSKMKCFTKQQMDLVQCFILELWPIVTVQSFSEKTHSMFSVLYALMSVEMWRPRERCKISEKKLPLKIFQRKKMKIWWNMGKKLLWNIYYITQNFAYLKKWMCCEHFHVNEIFFMQMIISLHM